MAAAHAKCQCYRSDPFEWLTIWADRLPFASDLVLAGHSHGGQVRLPWLGALVRPQHVGPYEMGWYSTPAGPLYVNPGIGCLGFDVRFNCRPEVAVFEV